MKKNLTISNAKGLLIFLVVFGHFLEIYTFDHYELFIVIYSFHMPLFIFINGYLTKRMNLKKILNLLILYFIFHTFFKIFIAFIGIEPLLFKYKNPYYHLWYLVSLVYWYLLSWLLLKLDLSKKWKYIVFIGFMLLVFITRLDDGSILRFFKRFDGDLYLYSYSYLRTLSYLPFFLLGFFMDESMFAKMTTFFKNKLFVLTSLVASFFLIVWLFYNTLGVEAILKGRYERTFFIPEGGTLVIGVVKLIFYYGFVSWICLLVLNLVSKKETFLTKWGDRSLPIYLFHPIIPILLRQTSIVSGWTPGTKRIWYLLLAILTTIVLSSNLFVKMTRPFCQPYLTLEKLFNRIKQSKQ